MVVGEAIGNVIIVTDRICLYLASIVGKLIADVQQLWSNTIEGIPHTKESDQPKHILDVHRIEWANSSCLFVKDKDYYTLSVYLPGKSSICGGLEIAEQVKVDECMNVWIATFMCPGPSQNEAWLLMTTQTCLYIQRHGEIRRINVYIWSYGSRWEITFGYWFARECIRDKCHCQ